MSITDDRRRFCETYVTEKAGHPFSLEKRKWVLDEMWRPLDGFKAWPAAWTSGKMPEGAQLCEACASIAGAIIEDPSEVDVTRTPGHKRMTGGCDGLRAEPIVVVVQCLPRREGKTTNAAGFCLSSIFKYEQQHITYVAAAEDQTSELVQSNFVAPVLAHDELRDRAHLVGDTIHVPGLKSKIEAVSTSHKSITGRGRTLIVIDEARDIEARVAMALIPSVFDAGGAECPTGHWRTQEKKQAKESCPMCGKKTRLWIGRVLIMSAAGIEEGKSDKDWFKDLVEHLEANPHPNYHLHRRDTRSNPAISDTTVRAVDEVFGEMEATRDFIRAETGNQFTQKGRPFLTDGQISQVVDNRLKNSEGSTRRCVAFVDTSDTGDLTSLVILGEDERSSKPFEYLVTERIDFWDPKDRRQVPKGIIDAETVLPHLDLLIPMFPALVALHIDTRLRPWARNLVRTIKQEKGPGGNRRAWGRHVDGWDKGAHERAAAWEALESRVLEGTIAIPNHARLRKEIKGLKATRSGQNDRLNVQDRNRKRSHADIADALAVCCLLAHQRALKGGGERQSDIENHPAIKALMNKTSMPVTFGLSIDSL